MPTNTPNLNLIKPLVSENYTVAVANANNDILDGAVNGKQPALVSGTNIKTINGNSVLGSGDLIIAHNQIINGNFQVNQRANSGTVVLTAGQYGHDRWKAGASGCTYTFATVENITTLTISAGSLIQVVEGLNLETGTYCLSWEGTAQGKIGGGSYGASGITGLAVGGTNLNVEFNTGTLKKVSFVKGSLPSVFIVQPYADVLRECLRYYWKISAQESFTQYALGYCVDTVSADFQFNFPVEMRVMPSSLEYSNIVVNDINIAYRALTSLTFTVANKSKFGCLLRAVSSSLTPYKISALNANNTTSSFIAFSAEL